MVPRTAWSASKEIQDRNVVQGGYYVSIRWSLLIAKYGGLLPIVGQFQQSGLTRCNWKSLWTLFYFACLILHVSIIIIHFYDILSSGFGLSKSSDFFLYFNMLLLICFLIRSSRKLEATFKETELIERKLLSIKNARNAVNRTNFLVISLHVIGLFEHILYILFTIDCFSSSDDNLINAKLYFMKKFPWFYNHFPFNFATGFLFEIFSLQGIILANFTDGLVMVTSIYLRKRFEQFNRVLNRKQFKTRDTKPTWSELQIQYTRLSRLVVIVDDVVNPFVFVSFFSKFLFISQQLYFMFNKLTKSNFVAFSNCFEDSKYDWDTILYLTFSKLFAIGRIILLSYLSAELHTSSRVPLYALYTVPSSAYNTGMYRLMNQVYHSKVGLTGFKFFYVTRGTVLSMVASLMTYELVLLQI